VDRKRRDEIDSRRDAPQRKITKRLDSSLDNSPEDIGERSPTEDTGATPKSLGTFSNHNSLDRTKHYQDQDSMSRQGETMEVLDTPQARQYERTYDTQQGSSSSSSRRKQASKQAVP
jgi:hypothetical protein